MDNKIELEDRKVPLGGTPDLIDTRSGLAECVRLLDKGEGPIAIDAERASGFRYSARAYLIQLHRRGSGIFLLDPIALDGASEIRDLNRIIAANEAIIHASSQDLACLHEFGITPTHLFDTELGARIAGCERVGLSSLCESLLGISLAKEHSAVDWSTRPLHQEWLDYAALDVDVLLDLRYKVGELLDAQGKSEWAKEEFSAALTILSNKPEPKRDPWRRTSGMHVIKSRFELAIVRELWIKRDEIAREIDLAPGRLFSDAIIIDVATKKPKSKKEFVELPSVKQRIRRDYLRDRIDTWWQIITASYSITEDRWPQLRGVGDAIPPARIWKVRFPIAHAHLTHARASLLEKSNELNIPVENLISPELVRRIAFDNGHEKVHPDTATSRARIEAELREKGARPWQIELCLPLLADALTQREPRELPAPQESATE